MNKIQSKNYRTETYEINKISYDALMTKYTSKTMNMTDFPLVIRVSYKKTVILITSQHSF